MVAEETCLNPVHKDHRGRDNLKKSPELQDRQLKKPESELMKFTDGILKAKKAMRNLKTLQTSIMNFMLKWDVKFSRIS